MSAFYHINPIIRERDIWGGLRVVTVNRFTPDETSSSVQYQLDSPNANVVALTPVTVGENDYGYIWNATLLVQFRLHPNGDDAEDGGEA